VLADIAQAFFGHAEQAVFQHGIQVFQHGGEIELQFEGVTFSRGAGQLLQREFEPQVVQRAGAQGLNGAAGFHQPAAGDVQGLVENAVGLIGILVPQHGDSFQVDGQAAEGVCQGIVQFASHSVAFPADGELLQCGGITG